MIPPLADIHNHVIPGVDDGARTLDEGLAALSAMYEQGVRRVVATPHLDAELTHRPERLAQRLAKIDEAWATLHPAAAERFPELQLSRGHEIMLDVPRLELEDRRLRLAGGRYVLVEFPRLFVPAGSTGLLYQLRLSGWVPLVAHPERYVAGAAAQLQLVAEWRQVGARMIVNAGSLMGGFGREAQQTVLELLRRGWADLVGSDFHARPSRPLLLRQSYEQLSAWGGEEQARLLLSENPGRVIDGEDLLDVQPLQVAGGVWGRLRRLLGR